MEILRRIKEIFVPKPEKIAQKAENTVAKSLKNGKVIPIQIGSLLRDPDQAKLFKEICVDFLSGEKTRIKAAEERIKGLSHTQKADLALRLAELMRKENNG